MRSDNGLNRDAEAVRALRARNGSCCCRPRGSRACPRAESGGAPGRPTTVRWHGRQIRAYHRSCPIDIALVMEDVIDAIRFAREIMQIDLPPDAKMTLVGEVADQFWVTLRDSLRTTNVVKLAGRDALRPSSSPAKAQLASKTVVRPILYACASRGDNRAQASPISV